MGKLGYYRKKLDAIDRNIVKLLLLRFGLVKQIANCKKKGKLKIIDKKRELRVIKNIQKYSDRKNRKFMSNIFRNIINYSRKMQSK